MVFNLGTLDVYRVALDFTVGKVGLRDEPGPPVTVTATGSGSNPDLR
jgi:hypothetical protein